ncbi:MAG: hypothetical protein GC180_07285 [Bacteroidetes bacterium]|nr:hypothetical protein [Bacteroidota bacterium]
MHTVIKSNRVPSEDHLVLFKPNDRLPPLKTDRGLVEQILLNILHNALQYTPEGSVIEIEVMLAGEHCRFVISDNGPGFPDNEILSVFDKFYRISRTAPGGTGLGLSIAKGFTEALSGKIILENIEPHGARFTVVIPAEISTFNASIDE